MIVSDQNWNLAEWGGRRPTSACNGCRLNQRTRILSAGRFGTEPSITSRFRYRSGPVL